MSETLENLVLSSLPIKDSMEFASENKVTHEVLLGVIQSLWTDEYVTMSAQSKKWLERTAEGEDIVSRGKSPEYRVWEAVRDGEAVDDKVGMGNAMKLKWISRQKRDDGTVSLEAKPGVEDSTLVALTQLDANSAKDLTRRKLVVQKTMKYFAVEKGAQWKAKRTKKVGDLTAEALKDGSWKSAEFKSYNFAALGERVGGGYFQPLLKVRAEFRAILMGMGFEEMPTNRWVESSFWNFDALFQPQSHPARDAHDTFFTKDHTLDIPKDYYDRVKTMHQVGGHGSIGHRSPFDEDETRKNLLRTHTTAVSARMLYELGKAETFTPKRYFSVDRVFRNESMDSTHLCEFHQVEGLIADYDLSLSNLIATIRTFFAKIGITQLRFKPAFNPYTEPSMEVFGYHPTLKKWTEIGNSGIFRPEMLKPMGLPDNVRVIAWGLSLERPTMIKYKINNIRDLFGHKADINRTKATPICIFP